MLKLDQDGHWLLTDVSSDSSNGQADVLLEDQHILCKLSWMAMEN